ncbi:hypothetical protein KUTeg_008176 [Tegillarca granosa]|uniref:Transmembrane protein 198 n=1 Tax=Tegillarca granosa TaxID=220873 RepID=A0ABQ9FBH4_TEGGR|nr:hypothetical protein KUTeg_008176 [Tegillarca granosa]
MDSIRQGRQLLQSTTGVRDYDPTENSTGFTIPGQDSTTTLPFQSFTCDKIDFNYNIPLAVICPMCFIFGIIYTFFGYRFFKAVMFLTGFIFVSVLFYLILTEHALLPLEGNIGIAVGAGIVCGLVTMLVQYVGLFLTGFQLGLSIGICSLIVIEQFYHPEIIWIPVGILCGVGVILAIITLKFQKGCTILGTSMFGGALMISCLDYFIEQFLMVNYVWERAKAELSSPVCWYSWVILCCWPFCFLVGSVTQWKITGEGYDHKEVLHTKKVKHVNLQRQRQRQKKDTQESRYRHLYQVRRTTGDVIAQSYIKSIQQKFSPSTKRHHIAVPTEPSTTELDSANTTLTQVP